MGKIGAAFLVVLVAGCSNMGMRTSGSSFGGMEASSDAAVFPGELKRQGSGGTVIDPRTGRLTLYHGG